MSGLVAFLIARYDEDAVRATMREIHTLNCEQVPNDDGYTYPCDCGVPERMMREVEAKRKILAEYGRVMRALGPHLAGPLRHVLIALAAVYQDHPDYDKDWA